MNVDIIKHLVANHYGITVERMDGKTREFIVTRARHVAMYLSRVVLRSSWPALGRAFRRDHTSVLDGHKRIAALIKHDNGTRADVDLLLASIANYRGEYIGPVQCPTCGHLQEEDTVISIRAQMHRLQERVNDLGKGAA